MKKYSTTLIGLALFAACYVLVRQQTNTINARQAASPSIIIQANTTATTQAPATQAQNTLAYRLIKPS